METQISTIQHQKMVIKKQGTSIEEKEKDILNKRNKKYKLHGRVNELRDNITLLTEKVRNSIFIPNPPPDNTPDRLTMLSGSIEEVTKHYLPWVRNSNRDLTLRNLLDTGAILGAGQYLQNKTIQVVKKLARIEFCAWKVLRAIDSSEQGGLNITGAAIYQSVQQLQKYERGFLISKGPVVRASRELEQKVKTMIDWHVVRLPGEGERIEFKLFSNILGLSID